MPTLHDSGLGNVLWGLFGTQIPGDFEAVAGLVIRCQKRDLALSVELDADLVMQRLLMRLDRQQEICTMLLELQENEHWVWSLSEQMSILTRSRSLSSCLSTASSWFSPVALHHA